MTAQVILPQADGYLETWRLSTPRSFARQASMQRTRIAYSAAHVVADPLADIDAWLASAPDWEATMAYRRYLIILIASRALAASARGPEDYAHVYGRILSGVREPVILHWLGEMFDPALTGYWGHDDHWQAMDVCLEIIAAHAGKVEGIKVSLLSEDKEIAIIPLRSLSA